jgi:adenosine deaminase
MKNNWHKALHNALIKKDKGLFKKVPHTDLHCHSITSAPFSAFKELFPGIKLPPRHFKNSKEFNLFIKNNIAPVVRGIDTVRYLIRAAFQRLVEEGVIYTEMSFDLLIPEHIGVSMEEYLEVINEEKKRVAKKLNVCIEAGIDREINPQYLLQLFKKSLKNNIFGSIDLYGNENANPIEKFIDIYKLADRKNFKLKAHIGEFGTAQDMKKAIQKLNLHAIQHGIAAVQDKEVIRLLIKKNISLNICPYSNIVLGVVKNIAEHPIQRLFNEGVSVTVNSDDFSIFNKSVSEGLINLYSHGIFSEKEVVKIINNGLTQITGKNI